MNIINGIHQANNTYISGTSFIKKARFEEINTITAEDIVAKIKSLGNNVYVLLDECERHSISRTLEPGMHINISPIILQRMVDDPVFRERQFDIIRNNLDVISDPRILIGRDLQAKGSLSFSMLMTSVVSESHWTFTLDRSAGSDARYVGPSNGTASPGRVSSGDLVATTRTFPEGNISSNQTLFQPLPGNLSTRQSEKTSVSYDNSIHENLPPGMASIGRDGHVIDRTNIRSVTIEHGGLRWDALVTTSGVWIAKEGWQSREEFELLDVSQGFADIPESVLLELEYLGKMLQHMPPNRTNTGGSSNITATPENNSVAQTSQTREILQDSLRQISNAFAAVHEGLGSSNQNLPHLKSAFLLMLRSTPVLAAHLARLNLNGEDAASLDSETIKQMHEYAQRQIDLFGEIFLDKFKQYGIEDGFNVAWALLYNNLPG